MPFKLMELPFCHDFVFLAKAGCSAGRWRLGVSKRKLLKVTIVACGSLKSNSNISSETYVSKLQYEKFNDKSLIIEEATI